MPRPKGTVRKTTPSRPCQHCGGKANILRDATTYRRWKCETCGLLIHTCNRKLKKDAAAVCDAVLPDPGPPLSMSGVSADHLLHRTCAASASVDDDTALKPDGAGHDEELQMLTGPLTAEALRWRRW